MKKKLLIITPYMPYPLNSGGTIAQFEMCNSLRKTYNIIMIFPLKNVEDFVNYEVLKGKWPDVVFYPFYFKFYSKLVKKIKEVYSSLLRRYYKVMRIGSKLTETDRFLIDSTTVFQSGRIEFDISFSNHIKRAIENIDALDGIQVEFFELLPLITYLPKDIPSFFVHHELRYIREKRELDIFEADVTSLRKLQQKNERFELFWLKKYNYILTVSMGDGNLLTKGVLPAKIMVSPLGIKYQDTIATTYRFANRLVFLGGSDHFPNKEGVNWFIRTCWRELKTKHTDLSLIIVGKWRDQEIKEYANFEGITFMGFVEELSSVLSNSIFIVPVRIGSGIRMKIIEAVNYGLPFVTTTVGVEGLNFKRDIDCLIGDTPTEFTANITQIIESDSLAENLIRNSKETLSHSFSFESNIEKRKSIYESIL